MKLKTAFTATLLAVAVASPAYPAEPGPDLSLTADSPQLPGSSAGIQHLEVTNNGSGPLTADLRLTYVTPFYVNVDRDQPLPAGCEMRYTNPDPTVPEVVACTRPEDLPAGDSVGFDIPIKVTSRARFVGRDAGGAVAAPGDGQVDADLTDNWAEAYLTVVRPVPALPDANPVNLWVTHDIPAISAGHDADITLQYGNNGDNAMTGETRIVMVTPFFVNYRQDELPAECESVLTDPDPLVPEIVVCDQAGMAKDEVRELVLPLTITPEAPRGHLYSTALVAPAGESDADVDQVANLDGPGVNNITNVSVD